MPPGSTPSLLPTLLAPILLAAFSTAGANTRYEGLAYAKGTQRLLYREEHWLHTSGSERLVLYRCPGGEPFARKVVRGKGATPDFEFLDARTGYAEGVRTRGSQREIFVRQASNAPEQRSTILSGEVQVIDAGFDSFVRQQWDSLAPPGQSRVSFLVPSRGEAMDFRVVPSNGKSGTRSFRLSLDTWYGRALPSLAVTYSSRGQRLLQFEGIGNIRDGGGNYVPVRIEFPADRHTVGSAADRAVAAAAPLVSTCGA